MIFTINEYAAKLPMPPDEKWIDGVWDVEAHREGKISLVFFAPKGDDRQSFHDDDEYYFIAKGRGEILIGGERYEVETGDAIFVPAGVRHRFENFSDDFATWAVFF